MNGEYIITPGQVYYTERKGGERFRINNQNKVTYKSGSVIEGFSNLDKMSNFTKDIEKAFSELGELETEKGNLIIFNNKNGDNIYIYNSLEKLEKFDNDFIYSNLLFEKREDQIIAKTEDFCNFALSENIGSISNSAKLETLRNKEEFLLTMENENFIRNEIKTIDDRLLEDIFLLGKGCHIGYYGKLYMYAFLENKGQLIPIYFNYDNLYEYDVSETLVFDKIDIIIEMEGKEKVSLLLMKIMENIMIFKADVIKESELQIFYNKLFEKNKSIYEEMKDYYEELQLNNEIDDLDNNTQLIDD